MHKKILKKDIESHFEDLGLINLILQKDSDALEKLFVKYNYRLACFIKIFIPSYDDVQDILQNTFITILYSLNSYNGESQLFTWMCGIARHKIADYYRTNHKKIESLDYLTEKGDWLSTFESNNLSIDDWLLRLELSEKVHAIIGTMPEHYQSILIDKYINQKTLKEIAASRNISEKAADSLNSRARKLFKQLVEKNNYFSRGGNHD